MQDNIEFCWVLWPASLAKKEQIIKSFKALFNSDSKCIKFLLSHLCKLLDKLTEYNVRSSGVDVTFCEHNIIEEVWCIVRKIASFFFSCIFKKNGKSRLVVHCKK